MDTVNTGLNGIPICASDISVTTPDTEGRPHLFYKGHSIYDLAKRPFEESVYLILNGKLPDKTGFQEFNKTFKRDRHLDGRVIDHIRSYPANANRMDLLLTTLSYARMFDEDYDNCLWRDVAANPVEIASLIQRVGLRMGAKIPTIISYGWRISRGEKPIEPDDSLSHAANILRMIGLPHDDERAKALDTTLTLYMDHTITNSTFIARVTESARTDPYGPFIAAAAGLKGVLHGGANEMARRMIDEIGDGDARDYILGKMQRSEVIFGFGHRLTTYKSGVESRVAIAQSVARSLTEKVGLTRLMKTYDELTKTMMSDDVEERKRRAPNLDLPVSIIYLALGIPLDLNTPIFQSSRHFGWVAHMKSQRLDKCPLYRPTQRDIMKA